MVVVQAQEPVVALTRPFAIVPAGLHHLRRPRQPVRKTTVFDDPCGSMARGGPSQSDYNQLKTLFKKLRLFLYLI